MLELTNGLSPIVLTPADNKYDFAYMVLPVRIKTAENGRKTMEVTVKKARPPRF